ncbi:MAG TPA: DUF4145 domain-containing protein [Solirubrobacteraceae bacterium]|jgi:hypothetical protein
MPTGCGHCGFKGELERKDDVVAAQETEWDERIGDITIETRWTLARCPNCERPTLESYVWVEPIYSEPDDARFERIYPTLLDNDALPQRVRAQLDAAYRVKVVDPSFYAVGIRRTLEAVCNERGASARTLEGQIQILVDRDELPKVFAAMAAQLRRLGNWGAHDSATSVLEQDVPLIEEFADAILDYLYRAPAKVHAVEAALKDRIDRAGAAERTA